MSPTSWSKFSDARGLTFTKFSGPALPQESMWVSQARANSLLRYSQRWDIDTDYRNDKASMGWVRHDACTVLRFHGLALGATGQRGPDAQLSWFPWHPADDPIVGGLGFTARAARLMRLMGVVLSQNEAYEDQFWYADGQALYRAQSVEDVRGRRPTRRMRLTR